MDQPTPQQQVDNIVAGLHNTYQAVAVRHVHPWYSWGLMAAMVGFALGVVYVSNSGGDFVASKAAMCADSFTKTVGPKTGTTKITSWTKTDQDNYNAALGKSSNQRSAKENQLIAKVDAAKAGAVQSCQSQVSAQEGEVIKNCERIAKNCIPTEQCGFTLTAPSGPSCGPATCAKQGSALVCTSTATPATTKSCSCAAKTTTGGPGTGGDPVGGPTTGGGDVGGPTTGDDPKKPLGPTEEPEVHLLPRSPATVPPEPEGYKPPTNQ
jgi:hypothetical protein